MSFAARLEQLRLWLQRRLYPPKHLTYVSFLLGADTSIGVAILEGAFYFAEDAELECIIRGIPVSAACTGIVTLVGKKSDHFLPSALWEAMAANTNRLLSPDEARELFMDKSHREEVLH